MTLQMEEARARFINELRGKTGEEILEQIKHVMLDALDFGIDNVTSDRLEGAIHIFEQEPPSNEFDDEACECCGKGPFPL